MKIIVALSAFLVVASLAQEPILPKPETQDSASPSTPRASVSPSPAPELIPADLLSAAERAASTNLPPASIPAMPQFDELFKPNPASAAADNARHHGEWRQLQNRVANDGDLKTALLFAEAAKTDLEKRRRLKNYYELYYGKLLALTDRPDLKAYLAERKTAQLNALPQPRVRPASPTPSPKQ